MGVVGDDLERPAAYVGDVVQRQSVRGSVQPRLDHPRQVLERERGAAHTTRGDQDVDGGEIGVVPGQHDPRLDRLRTAGDDPDEDLSDAYLERAYADVGNGLPDDVHRRLTQRHLLVGDDVDGGARKQCGRQVECRADVRCRVTSLERGDGRLT